jgi:methyltransferase-like protein
MPPDVAQFRGRDDSKLSTNHPLSIAAMEILAEIWPLAMSFPELVVAARRRLGDTPAKPVAGGAQEITTLASTLLSAHGRSLQLLELHSYHPQVVNRVSERPVASLVARFEAETRQIVTNMWHDRVTLLPVQQSILRTLDGKRTQPELAKLLRGAVTPEQLDEHLRFLAYAGLLVA